MTVAMLGESPTIHTASALLRSGRVCAVELLEHVIGRIEETEPHVHAYVSHDLDQARRDAADADRTPPRGPLHGIPFGVKDVFAVAGGRTRCGSQALADHVTERDATVVAALRAAGAVLVGKHVTHELTCGVDEPPTRNPHAWNHYAGGSSVGSGVSVAAGSSLFALGTDAAGSVRIPASATGVVGFKPTHGLLSTEGIVRASTAPSIDHAGILARTVEDVGLVLEGLAPGTIGPIGHGVRGMRLGVLQFGGDRDADPEVTALFDRALDRLAGLGACLVPVDIPELRDAPDVVATYFATELAEGNRLLFAQRQADYHPAVRQLITAGLRIPEHTRKAARTLRTRITAAVANAFLQEQLDALVSPTMSRPPPRLDDLNPDADLPRIVAHTCPFNLTGQPAISVPCGVTAAGLPVGLQIAGRQHDETTVLTIAAAYSPPPIPINHVWS
ncbi:MAG: amidase [Hyphomicrobiales bacterium]|nr:MAG: amidase [Hyphomicrobiales bacterium]